MRERSAPPVVPSLSNFTILDTDPVHFLEAPTSSTVDLSSRMANIFDESDDETICAEKTSEQQAPRQLFTATVFLSIPNVLQSIKFGLVLVKSFEKANIILYDGSKKNVIHTSVDETKFEFDDTQRTAKFETTIGDKKQELSITFIESSELQRFAILLLLHSSVSDPSTSYYILNRGIGDPIELDCSVLYDKVKHKIDEEEDMSLPFVQNNIKAKLSVEKVTGNILNSLFIGLSKGANILLKTSESTVSQVTLRKIKYPGEKKEKTPPETTNTETENIIEEQIEKQTESEPATSEHSDLKERMAKIGRSIVPLLQSKAVPESSIQTEKDRKIEALVEEHEEKTEIPNAPSSTSNLTSTDIHELLHRVVGVEIDRINIRLDAKFDTFRNEVLSRLDRQNDLLEKILAKDQSNS